MVRHHFLSYSSVDGREFALWLADALQVGPPAFPVWLDKRRLRPGDPWDEQLVEAIRECDSLLFVMTRDSIHPRSVCKQEWMQALRYKKVIVPLRLHADAELPFLLEFRQVIDFSGSRESALARLRTHLQWIDSPVGRFHALRDRLEDAYRDRNRMVEPSDLQRVEAEIRQLQAELQEHQRRVEDPRAAAQRTEARVARGIELERQPEKPARASGHSRFINPPPVVAPGYFQDRHTETRLLSDFLREEAQRLALVVGRGGTGKTAMVCRLLKTLETGHLPDEGGPFQADGIVYLNARGSRQVRLPHLYSDLGKLLSEDKARHLDALYKDPLVSTEAKMRALLAEFPHGRVVVLLDNFEDVVDATTLTIQDAELEEALRALLTAPPHALKVIVTTRLAPKELLLEQPHAQMVLNLDDGLCSPHAEEVLRRMDADGKLGLKTAQESLLGEARERTRGNPRALEALVAILRADRNTSLREILDNTRQLLPESVVKVLVGEAFSLLDADAQRVMQALAVYGSHPVTPTAVDYLLQPYVPGVNSAPVLGRLVNMQFARREADSRRYYLNPVDQAYALARVPPGSEADRDARPLPFTQAALFHRAADYFEQIRLPRWSWKTLEDLEPMLDEFDLRLLSGEATTAARLLDLLEGDYLARWGYYRLLLGMRERLQGRLHEPPWQQWNFQGLGRIHTSLGCYHTAINAYERALELARECKDRRREGALLTHLAICYSELGQIPQAHDHAERALEIARAVGNRQGESEAEGVLGWCYMESGRLAEAISCHERALAISRALKCRVSEGYALVSLGECYDKLGQNSRALDHFEQALAIARDTKDRPQEGRTLGALGNCYANMGQTQRAVEFYEKALAFARETEDRVSEAVWLINLSNCHDELGQASSAISHAQKALAIAREAGHRRVEGRILDHLARVLLGTGQDDAAVQHATDGLRIAEEIGSPEVGSSNGALLALAYMLRRDFSRARSMAELAWLYDDFGHKPYVSTLLGVIALRQGDRPAALSAFRATVTQVDSLLAHSVPSYELFDDKALALCGLTLCGEGDHRESAAETFRAARARNRAPGSVARVLRVFDALAESDSTALLPGLRAMAGATEGSSGTNAHP